MSKILYFLAAFAESGLSVFGVRGSYEQPSYSVERTLAPDIELRRYAPRVAVETPITDAGDGEAFGKLFRYITGANATHRLVPMTAPVEQSSQMVPMTTPVEMGRNGGHAAMRFFLPAKLAQAGAPVPTEAGVAIVKLPAVVLGVVRFSGTPGQSARAAQTTRLRAALGQAGLTSSGEPILFYYDPPFTVPMFRRNEVALEIVDKGS